MKKIIVTMMALVMFVTAFGITPLNANAASKEETGKVTVYDGSGAYVGEFDSIEEFQREVLGRNAQQRGVAAWLVTASAVYGVVTLILDVSYLFTGIDAKVWIRENVMVPFFDEAKKMELYSVSGGITNPYPPNSYQYQQFNKTNYYWVTY